MRAATSGLPTFDCKGFILIVFSGSERKIIVKYSHTPIHRTVASRREMKGRLVKEAHDRGIERGVGRLPITDRSLSLLPPYQSDVIASIPPGPHHAGIPNTASSQLGSLLNTGNPEVPGNQSTSSGRKTSYVPNENLRRRALNLLSENSIEKNSLSEEQMIVFENQLPIIQAQSVRLFKDIGPTSLSIARYHGINIFSLQPLQPQNVSLLAVDASALPLQGSYPELPQPEARPENQGIRGSTEPERVKKTRSRAGCLMCRKDKVKVDEYLFVRFPVPKVLSDSIQCDEIHPVCGKCTRNRSLCAWPAPQPEKTKGQSKRGRPRKSALSEALHSSASEYYTPPPEMPYLAQ
jgi:ATP-dependent DNA helicase 2 subunit 1